MPKIHVKRFTQDAKNQCALGAVTCVSNCADSSWGFSRVAGVVRSWNKDSLKNGLYSFGICSLLNLVGFDKVVYVTSDTDIIDYSWAGLSHKKLARKMLSRKSRYHAALYNSMKSYFSDTGYDNSIVIDWNFADRIRESIDNGVPVIVSFNWTMYFRQMKDFKDKPNDMKGEPTFHAVVVNGYDKMHAYIVDSHTEQYKYKLKEFKTGIYKIKWEHLMAVMGREGDVIIPTNYNSRVES